MIGETIVRQAAARKSYQGNLFELYAWFFMRVSGVILGVIVLAHLMYQHFGTPGVAGIKWDTIVGRWTDPQMGTAWRIFDLILLIFAFTHGSNGVRYVLEDYVPDRAWRTLLKTMLFLVYLILLLAGSYIIFSFKTAI